MQLLARVAQILQSFIKAQAFRLLFYQNLCSTVTLSDVEECGCDMDNTIQFTVMREYGQITQRSLEV